MIMEVLFATENGRITRPARASTPQLPGLSILRTCSKLRGVGCAALASFNTVVWYLSMKSHVNQQTDQWNRSIRTFPRIKLNVQLSQGHVQHARTIARYHPVGLLRAIVQNLEKAKKDGQALTSVNLVLKFEPTFLTETENSPKLQHPDLYALHPNQMFDVLGTPWDALDLRYWMGFLKTHLAFLVKMYDKKFADLPHVAVHTNVEPLEDDAQYRRIKEQVVTFKDSRNARMGVLFLKSTQSKKEQGIKTRDMPYQEDWDMHYEHDDPAKFWIH